MINESEARKVQWYSKKEKYHMEKAREYQRKVAASMREAEKYRKLITNINQEEMFK